MKLAKFCFHKIKITSPSSQSFAPRPRQELPVSRSGLVVVQARSGRDAIIESDADIVNMTRRRLGSSQGNSGSKASSKLEVDSDADFVTKLKAAWRIFFPEKPRALSPKEEGKKRLRMILVADR